MNILVLDTETTGISKQDQVIELAYFEISLQSMIDDRGFKETEQYIVDLLKRTTTQRYFPSCVMNPRAYEVHGIGLLDLMGKTKSKDLEIPKNVKYIIGHNISFDKRMIGQTNKDLINQLENIKYICTLTLAKTIQKHSNLKFQDNKLDTLVEFFFPDEAKLLLTEKHSANYDVVKTFLVFLRLVELLPNLKTWDDVYNFQTSLKKVK